MAAPPTIGPDSRMRELLAAYPGAQRALFRRYHLGGCSSCAFDLDETLAELCRRAGDLNVDEVLAHLAASHEADAQVLMEPKELAERLERGEAIRLVDVRSRAEFDAVRLEGSVLLSQPVMREILAAGADDRPLVIIDHRGTQGLDAATYFLGHGVRGVRSLRGGIDAWAQEVDPGMPRYRIENQNLA